MQLPDIRIVIYASILFLCCFRPVLAADRALVFTPLPIEQPETVVAATRPLVDYLASQLGVRITIRHEKKYEDIIRLFKEGKIDIVHLGPLPYVSLRSDCPDAEPLAAIKEPDGKASYTCAIVTAFDGPPSVSKIRKSVALTQPLSTCGHLTAGYLLNRHQIKLESVTHDYLGNHDKVALAVARGLYEAGSMKTSVAQKYTNLTLRVIEETPPFPGLLLVGNKATLKQDQIALIKKALLRLPGQEKDRLVLGKYGFAAVNDADYRLIRHYMKFFK